MAMSGIIPRMKNRLLAVRYVVIARTSHARGDRKFGHNPPKFGIGNIQCATQTLPRWMKGNNPAVAKPNTVTASALR